MSSPAFVTGNLTRTPQLSRTTEGTPDPGVALRDVPENPRRQIRLDSCE